MEGVYTRPGGYRVIFWGVSRCLQKPTDFPKFCKTRPPLHIEEGISTGLGA